MSSPHLSHKFHSHVHLKWNKDLKPIHIVDSGSEVSFDLLDGGHNQFTEKSTSADVPTFDLALGDPAIGPVYVNGAEPGTYISKSYVVPSIFRGIRTDVNLIGNAGDVLKVEFLELRTANFGWTAIFPGASKFGLLADEFPSHALKIWDLETHRAEGFAIFKEGIHIPLRPFLGVVGLAHAEAGEFSTIPPYDTGGNIDCKHITVGSTLYLPVKVPGALLSCGDGHAAQGDGEVCGTAIETPMHATVRLTIEKNKPWVISPHYLTSTDVDVQAEGKERAGKGYYAALGIDADLLEASRKALRGLINWLVGEKGLTRDEAYMLASVSADLKIAEAVDMPNYGVACSLPLSIFVGPPYV
jgi:acetamidase/formamidase